MGSDSVQNDQGSHAAEWVDSNTYVLQQIDLFNWGAFDGRHSADIHPEGSAIIGPTGSGKTTLIDGLMTLITAQPRYNFASTGGHESDRDLMSYIRGVSGAGNATGDASHILRKGKTTAAISAKFKNARRYVQIAVIFRIDSSSSANADRKDLWIYSELADESIDDWLTILHAGGARELKQHAKNTPHLKVFDTKKTYLSQLRRCFEVGENAFTLLNRAAGLKQINSINEVFRELVLDDRSVFDRATEVAKEFDDLKGIHAELETARRQQQSLAPIIRINARYQQNNAALNQNRQLISLLPTWIATIGARLWHAKLQQLSQKVAAAKDNLAENTKTLEHHRQQVDIAYQAYLQCGGSGIEQLKEHIQDQQKILNQCKLQASDYSQVMRSLQRDDQLTRSSFKENRSWASAQTEALVTEKLSLTDSMHEHGASLASAKQEVEKWTMELNEIRERPDSNIPYQYQQFRAELCVSLGLDEQVLPFIAELIEVKQTESHWRGAIERALGGHRLRMMTPPTSINAVLGWINGRDNRLHVRLLNAREPSKPAVFLDDGFAYKLQFKPRPYREVMKSLLADIDRHCVDSAEKLKHTPYGMTREGLMSGKADHFEKKDQIALNTDDWLTGFSNYDQVKRLTIVLQQAKQQLTDCQSRYTSARQQVESVDLNIKLLDNVLSMQFESIDLPTAENKLSLSEQRLSAATDPDSDMGKAKSSYENLKQAQVKIEQQREQLLHQQGQLQNQMQQADQQHQIYQQERGDGLNQEDQVVCEHEIGLPENEAPDHLEKYRNGQGNALRERQEKLLRKQTSLAQELVRTMEGAKKVDTGALAEIHTELEDIPAYLERLRVLNEEALPEKQERFLAYLNQSSDQGVTQLLVDVNNEVQHIQDRIHELNQTLKKVNFQKNRFLQLSPKPIKHEELRALERAQNDLRSAMVNPDTGESHFKALEHIVNIIRNASERKRTIGARSLLDPRYRLQFFVSVLDRDSGDLIESRSGSQGGSGGEKEIIASYILTASLSYALCPVGSTQPLFGTIVLDEAFSKSSQAVARRIISALKEFGLHSIFVTPNKEMRLLREHTRSALLVHMGKQGAILASLSWEELEQQAMKRLQN